MIVVPIILQSAVDGRTEILGTLIVDNIGGTDRRADYRCRMYRKQPDGRFPDLRQLLTTQQPIREGIVRNHRRRAEPVASLVAKALTATGYTL